MTDDVALDPSLPPAHTVPASVSRRLGTFVLDGLAIFAVQLVLSFFAGAMAFAIIEHAETIALAALLAVWLAYPAYYFLLEFAFGRTFGKWLMGTRVVTHRGGALTWRHALVRTMVRLVPFEPVSIFFGTQQRAWHDEWARTHVVYAHDPISGFIDAE